MDAVLNPMVQDLTLSRAGFREMSRKAVDLGIARIAESNLRSVLNIATPNGMLSSTTFISVPPVVRERRKNIAKNASSATAASKGGQSPLEMASPVAQFTGDFRAALL